MRSIPHTVRWLASTAAGLALSGGLLSCTGSIDSGGARYRGYEGPVSCDTTSAVTAPMRRLSRVEYDYVLEDLLGTTSDPAASFPPDDSTIGFEVGITVSDALARAYLDTGETLARDAVADLGALDPILRRCADGVLPTGTTADACAAEFITSFGRRAFRRPLTTEEITELTTLFRTGRDLEDFRTGIQLVVNAILVSPNFLYRVEPQRGTEGDVIGVADYELASRLSFFLWRSMPDEVLLDAAAAGELRTAMDVEMQARRMVEDARFERSHGDFFRQWLGLDRLDGLTKDDAVYPEWNDALATSLRASLDAFLDEAVENGNLDELVRGGYAFVDSTSAAHFGVTIPAGATPARDGLFRVALPATERAGLFTHPALLAMLGKSNQSDPIHRGVFVRQNVLCEVLEAPPADVPLIPPDLAPGLTTRERFDMHRDEPRCATCHSLIDPIGFGFESYDGIGRFRADEEGLPIDATGMVNAGGDANGPFDGAIELSARLANSNTFRSCFASQMFRFASGRVETRADVCSTEDLHARFEASGYDLRELMIAITQTDDFLFRRVGAAPVTP